MSTEELGYPSSSGQLPPPGPQEIIDLSESHSFIVTEVPQDNVMEGDGEEPDDPSVPEAKTWVLLYLEVCVNNQTLCPHVASLSNDLLSIFFIHEDLQMDISAVCYLVWQI